MKNSWRIRNRRIPSQLKMAAKLFFIVAQEKVFFVAMNVKEEEKALLEETEKSQNIQQHRHHKTF